MQPNQELQSHEGWLYLESTKRRGEWTNYYWRLDESHLRYFRSDDDLEPIATINCRGVEATSVGKARVGKHAFRLNMMIQEDGRCKYVMAGEEEEDSLERLGSVSTV